MQTSFNCERVLLQLVAINLYHKISDLAQSGAELKQDCNADETGMERSVQTSAPA